MRHYMMLLVGTMGSWRKMLVMEEMLEVFYFPNYVVEKLNPEIVKA